MAKQKITLGFSPCPNDTFMFDALVNGKLSTPDFEIEVHMADVEALNQMAFKSKLDVTKLSYHALAHATDRYGLLYSGSALGHACGPLLIARQPGEIADFNHSEAAIAIPGKFTTANFLLGLALPEATSKREMVFSEVEGAVLDGQCDAGLIIHENRFTYQDKGLHKIVDLGEYWEDSYALPIPLGGIAIKRDLPAATARAIDELIQESVKHAFENPASGSAYISEHAQEMDPEVMQSHIDLYVNDYSVQLGEAGQAAVNRLFEEARALKLVPDSDRSVYAY